MKQLSFLLLLLSIGCCMAQSLAEDPNDPHWVLAWNDEFNGSSMNASLWNRSYSWGNCSDQSALPNNWNNHHLNNGVLSLMTYEDNDTCFRWQGGPSPVYYPKPYTSAHLISKPAFKYGYYEIRSRFPKNQIRKIHNNIAYYSGEGFSPTFWLFPCYRNAFDGFIKYSEIDIYEVQGKTNGYTCNAHYSDSINYSLTSDGRYYSWWMLHPTGCDRSYEFTINDGVFHTYSILWDSLSINYYYDGNLVCGISQEDDYIPSRLLPMNIIIANSAYSGNFGDSIKSNTIMPYAYDIDYIKVYNLICDDETVVYDIPDFSQYYYAVKKSISMGNNTVFPADTLTYLHATDYIEMRPGFEVSGSSQVKFIIDPSCHEDNIYNYPW